MKKTKQKKTCHYGIDENRQGNRDKTNVSDKKERKKEQMSERKKDKQERMKEIKKVIKNERKKQREF